MKKILTLALGLLLIVTSIAPCFATEAVTATAPGVFSDVAAGSELEKAVSLLKQVGIVNGYEDGSFRPNNTLTRAEFCKMVNKTFDYTEKAEETFWDLKEDDWFRDEVLIAKKKGYIQGFEDGSFRGNSKITREQVCVILNRILGLYTLYDVAISDTVSDWAAYSVKAVISNGFMKLEEGATFRATQDILRHEFATLFVPFASAKLPSTGEGTGNQSGNQSDNNSGGPSGGPSGPSAPPAVAKYKVTVTQSVGGTISPETASFEKGTNVAITVAVNEGYILKSLVVDGKDVGAVTSYTIPSITAAHTVSAVYEKVLSTYKIEISANEGGTLSHSTTNVKEGDDLSVEISANEGYEIAEVLVDGKVVELEDGAYTFEDVSANHALSVKFERNVFNITVIQSEGGVISPASANVNKNGKKTFTVTPNNGYYIVDVLVDGESRGAVSSYEFENVTADSTITAKFELETVTPETYTITVTQPASGGKIDPGTSVVSKGSSKTFGISVHTNYELVEVIVDGVSVGKKTSYTFENISEDHTISVVLRELEMYKVSVTALNEGVSSIYINSNKYTTFGEEYFAEGKSLTVKIYVKSGYEIENVTINGKRQEAKATHNISKIDRDYEIEVSFKEITYTLDVTQSEGGTISPEAGEYAKNTDITLTFTADDGYRLSAIYIDGSRHGAIATFPLGKITKDYEVSADFVKIWTVTVTQNDGGTISPETTVADEGEDVTFVIEADEGYKIEDVLVDGVSVGKVTSYTFESIDDDHDIEASFAVDLSADDDVVAEMEALLTVFNSYKGLHHTNKVLTGSDEFKLFFDQIKGLVSDIITDSETTLITPEFVEQKYTVELGTTDDIMDAYDGLCEDCKAQFNRIATEIYDDFGNLLVNYFYDIIPEEVFE